VIKLGSIPIGILIDDAPVPKKARRVMFDALNLAFSDALKERLIDRPVEMITREVVGLQKGGRLSDVVNAWKELAAEGVVGIYGPWVSENAMGLRGYVENEGHIPTLSMTGTDKWYGEWCFNINNGSTAASVMAWFGKILSQVSRCTL
jgi:branched-chain amino acid transport system substrate-binding protein